MRILRGIQIVVTLAVIAVTPNSSFACTISETLESSDSLYVLIGRVQGYVSKLSENGRIYGIAIETLFEFQTPKPAGSEGYLSFPPNGLSADCQWSYHIDEASLERRYPLDSSIAIWANEFGSNDVATGSISLGQRLELLPDACDPTEVTRLTPNYSKGRSGCGSLYFHAHKEIAQLDDAEHDELLFVLGRLSEFPHFVAFENLVESLVDNAAERKSLIQRRYSEAIKLGCAEEPEHITEYGDDYFQKRSIRGRWFEYCNIERRKAARDGV